MKILFMQSEENPWKIRSSEVRYENPWIKITHHEVLTPVGKEGIYGTIHFKHIAIGIIVLDDQLNTWLVGQFRFPTNEYSWEIPEGGGKLEHSNLESAKRELEEETGIRAESWEEIIHMHLSNSASDEFAVVYLATNLSFGTSSPEETEQLSIRKIPFNTFFEEVEEHKITDSLTVAAAYKIKWMIDTGKIKSRS